MDVNTQYNNPLAERYASKEMLYNYSNLNRAIIWRECWIALAEAQQKLGLNISNEQIDELKKHKTTIDFNLIADYEKKLKHDVMAHIHAYGHLAPKAMPIIHLGATSAFVVDNTDIILMQKGLEIILKRIVNILHLMKNFSLEYKSLPTLAFTHFQPAQLTTVGKRNTLWMQSLLLDLSELLYKQTQLKANGVKGTTGTAASFKELFNGDYNKTKQLEKEIANKIGLNAVFSVSGQTYDRKIDSQILHLLSNIAQSAHKFSNDIRLLQHLKEIEEPFEQSQIGSSAMPYKRNPMRSERISSLAKFVISLSHSTEMVAATQWFERTLDDSANKRLSTPQAFLAIDAILMIWQNIVTGLVVYPAVIQKNINQELPFMATENILMEMVKKGGNRQLLHEKIRQHAMLAGKQVKEKGLPNDLLDRLMQDKDFNIDKNTLQSLLQAQNYIGFCIEQVDEFISNDINPVLQQYAHYIQAENINLKV